MHMTHDERVEWLYVYQERLGHLCGPNEPNPDAVAMAKAEADMAVLKLREGK